MTDVLKFWKPALDWSQFKQGAIPDANWAKFKEIVQLCHAALYWQMKVRQEQQAVLRPYVSPFQETKAQFSRRKREWEGEIQGLKTHMHRANYLAVNSIAEMSYQLTPEDQNANDQQYKLWLALKIAVGPQAPDIANCKAAAFEAFDADTDLEGDPVEIAMKWRAKDDDERIGRPKQQ